ncbi:MAG: hypothetical protein HF312_17235 [Ignavibacteria bacterium]|jgi:hypothetical protein|nr:hypothetical protein [Ignavibacteria bacterium]
MIIVTGADNTGKSTLVDHIADKFGIMKVDRYHTLPPVDYVDWYRWVKQVLDTRTHSIIDRFFVDEFVYGPLKRGKISLPEPKLGQLKYMFYRHRPLIIVCETDLETIESTYEQREQYPNLDEIPLVMAKFREVMDSEPFSECPVWYHNFTEPHAAEMTDRVVNIYLKSRR